MPDEPVTAAFVRRSCSMSLYRKAARTLISDQTFPPGTVFDTPEGLRAEDEQTRAAFDVQGGVYPIRESVFRASYVRDDSGDPSRPRCDFPSSVTDARCVLPLGHEPDSPLRFHRFAPR